MAMQNAIPLLITFLPIQVGTGNPSLTNVRPIRAPLMLTVENAYEFATKTSGQLNTNGETISESGMLVTEFISVQPGEVYEYTMTAKSSGARSRRIICYNADRAFISQLNLFNWMNADQVGTASITIPNNAEYVRISQFSTDTDISFSTVNGTSWPIYGGELDTLTGVLTETWYKIVADGVNIKANRGHYNNGTIRSYGGAIVYLDPLGNGGFNHAYCNIFRTDGNAVPTLVTYAAGNMYAVFYMFPYDDYAEQPDANTIMNATNEWLQEHPTTIVYLLKTPITHQLTTAQLKQAIKQLKPYY